MIYRIRFQLPTLSNDSFDMNESAYMSALNNRSLRTLVAKYSYIGIGSGGKFMRHKNNHDFMNKHEVK